MAKAKKEKFESLTGIYTIIDEIRENHDSYESGVKAKLRRARVGLSEISKLCKVARVELLKEMKK